MPVLVVAGALEAKPDDIVLGNAYRMAVYRLTRAAVPYQWGMGGEGERLCKRVGGCRVGAVVLRIFSRSGEGGGVS